MAYTTIKKPSDYFNTVLYVGNETDNHAITGVGFQPDFVWAKNRTVAESHNLFDSVRGATKLLIPNTTPAESTQATFLKSFDTDGFTLGTSNNINDSGANLVAWNWLANNTSGSSNTDGSITSTVSANTTSGFSIVSFTGTGSAGTVGHGLNSNLGMIIVKSRTSAGSNWTCWHKTLNQTDDYIFLNTTGAKGTISNVWNSTAPTSSVFGVPSGGYDNNLSGNNMIAYCFAEKQGFSKFGSYVGNGNADGTFVYTGFKPAWVMIKSSSSATTNWQIFDNKRTNNASNPTDDIIFANTSGAENLDSTANPIDFLSNGFKCRGTNVNSNSSGVSYIYMAFAAEPLVGDNPATAR